MSSSSSSSSTSSSVLPVWRRHRRRRQWYTMYHGTSARNATAILRGGGTFLPSQRGALGCGVYVTRNAEKARHYAGRDGAVLRVSVDVGRCYHVRSKRDPLRREWAAHGYDSAWAPAGVVGVREENCVWNPARIGNVEIYSGPAVDWPPPREAKAKEKKSRKRKKLQNWTLPLLPQQQPSCCDDKPLLPMYLHLESPNANACEVVNKSGGSCNVM